MSNTVEDAINAALNNEYRRSAGGMLKQIGNLSQSKRMQEALKELWADASALDAITISNPALQQSLGAYNDILSTAAVLIDANDEAIAIAGQSIAPGSVRARTFLQFASQIENPLDDAAFEALFKASGINWETRAGYEFANDFITSEAWIAKLEGWGEGYSKLTERTLLNGIAQGWGPEKIAEVMQYHAENIPQAAAVNLTRTLQITSYREAALQMEAINGDFIEKKIRIAHLDDRTCCACIALHGTELKRGERVDDHYRGRCSEYYVLPGGPKVPDMMQADSTPGNRQFTEWQTGEDWFASLPEARQMQQASFLGTPAKWNAYKDGVPLSAFVGEYQDPVFGRQIIEQSLKKSLGSDAGKYYVNPPNVPGVDLDKFNEINIDELDVFYGPRYEEFLQRGISPEMLESLNKYAGSRYTMMNDLARGIDFSDTDLMTMKRLDITEDVVKQWSANAQAAIEKSPGLLDDSVLWRGIYGKEIPNKFRSGIYQVGDTITDKAFTSTTFSRNATRYFSDDGSLVLKILAPRGTQGIYMESQTALKGEYEFLLGQNTEMKIHEIKEEGGKMIVTMILGG